MSETCKWMPDGPEEWRTECGCVFSYLGKQPGEGSFARCPCCGKKIERAARGGPMTAKEVWKAMHIDCLYKSGPGCLLGVGGSSCAFESCLLLKEAKAC